MKSSIIILSVIGLFLFVNQLPAQDLPPNFDQAYAQLKEAYQARQAGQDEISQKKLGEAFTMFRKIAARKGPKIIKSSSDFRVEENGREIKLFENRSLFKIEVKLGGTTPRQILQQQQKLIQQQRIILKNLALLTRQNSAAGTVLKSIDKKTRPIDRISSDIADIQDNTGEIADLGGQLRDIADSNGDVSDKVDNIEDNTSDIPEMASNISSIRDELDVLQEILDVVNDIKNDTEKIDDLQSDIQDMKSELDQSSSE